MPKTGIIVDLNNAEIASVEITNDFYGHPPEVVFYNGRRFVRVSTGGPPSARTTATERYMEKNDEP